MPQMTKKNDSIEELCARAMPKIEWVVRTKFSRSPVPGQTAEDIKQTIIANLIDHWRKVERGQAPGGELEEEARLLNYVVRAAFNGYDTQTRKARVRSQTDSYDTPESLLRTTLQARGHAPDEQAIIREKVERVWRIIWELPTKQFTAFFLIESDGPCGDDVATLLLALGFCDLL